MRKASTLNKLLLILPVLILGGFLISCGGGGGGTSGGGGGGENITLSGKVLWTSNMGQPQPATGVTVRAKINGTTVKNTTTDGNGNYQFNISSTVPVRVFVEVEASRNNIPVRSGRWSPEIEQGGSVSLENILLTDPTDLESLVRDQNQNQFIGSGIRVLNPPQEVQNIYARVYDPDVEREAFPGEFADDQGTPLNSTVFVWILGQDSSGNPVDQLSSPATVQIEIPRTQWPDIVDLEPGNGQIDIPVYYFDDDTGTWKRSQKDGVLVDENGNLIPENEEPNIRSGTYSGRVYAQFEADHFSYWNVDYPCQGPASPDQMDFGDLGGTYPSTLSQNGPRHRNSCSGAWLGANIDFETDAKTDDQDSFDDSILRLNPLTVRVTNWGWDGPLYLNVLIDKNNDGDWQDQGEWVVQNHQLNIPRRKAEAVVLEGVSWDGNSPIRITLSERTIPNYTGTVDQPFETGETEDYRQAKASIEISVSSWGDPGYGVEVKDENDASLGSCIAQTLVYEGGSWDGYTIPPFYEDTCFVEVPINSTVTISIVDNNASSDPSDYIGFIWPSDWDWENPNFQEFCYFYYPLDSCSLQVKSMRYGGLIIFNWGSGLY